MQLKEKEGITRKITPADTSYPALLKEINNPPTLLYAKGTVPETIPYALAIVGTRKASVYGKQRAYDIAKALANHNITVISGLAMGIDAAAHQGTLDASGTTLAVLANGLNTTYPRHHEQLAAAILKKGALISEYEPGAPPLPHQFLERNRIISGISNAVLIIEAPERSGALSTARHAADQGREVFVVPGPTNHPNFKGSHKLIRDGARLITDAHDLFEDLGLTPTPKTAAASERITDPHQRIVMKTIHNAGIPLSVDKIISQTTLEPHIIAQAITMLTMQELIKETEKGYIVG